MPLKIAVTVGNWLVVCTLALIGTLVKPPPEDRKEGSDRGDVPGWVMITMMTAIVVIALLAVFRDAVLDAVTSAFNSITGKD